MAKNLSLKSVSPKYMKSFLKWQSQRKRNRRSSLSKASLSSRFSLAKTQQLPLGCRQAVSQQVLVLSCVGSNPTTPAILRSIIFKIALRFYFSSTYKSVARLSKKRGYFRIFRGISPAGASAAVFAAAPFWEGMTRQDLSGKIPR